MSLTRLLSFRWLGVPYTPRPDERPFLSRVQAQQDDELVVRVAVLDDRESDRYFGVPLARRGVQPVWLEIQNQGEVPYRLRLASIDPNYYPPLEAAFINHFRIGRRLLEFGLLAWFFLPLLILLPFKLLGARAANRRMNFFFVEQGIGWSLIQPGHNQSGFIFTALDEGTKHICVRLLGTGRTKDFSFSIPIPGLRVDSHSKRMEMVGCSAETVECDEQALRKQLQALPRSTTNRRQTREGDPLNLVMIGEFATILHAFGARWDQTEVISLTSCARTLVAFLRGSRYRYSPVSALYVNGRCQDFALQKARQTINERLHLRLWMTPLRLSGKPVWIGQVSRDIGVRFTLRTWNLTTHKIDADVDDARDYVLDYLLESGRVGQLGYGAGVGAAKRTAPRHNLGGDPYFTDGLRAIAVFSPTRTEPTLFNWVEPSSCSVV
jgi:hypothetical protein